MKSQVLTHAYLVPIIATTEAEYNVLFGIVLAKDQKIGLRKAQRKTVVMVLDEAKVAAHSIESRVKDKLTKASPIYTELFGNGIDEYNHIILENAYLLISRLKDGVTTYVTEIGSDLKLVIDQVYTDFDVARRAQTTTAGAVKGNNPDYDANLLIMETQLFSNFLDVQKQNLTDPSRAWDFFDQPVLTRPSHHAGNPDNEPITLGIDPASQLEAGIAITVGRTYTFKNKGTKSLYFMGAFTADELIHPNSQELLPGESITITGDQLGSPNNRYLIFANKDLVELGVVKITFA